MAAVNSVLTWQNVISADLSQAYCKPRSAVILSISYYLSRIITSGSKKYPFAEFFGARAILPWIN